MMCMKNIKYISDLKSQTTFKTKILYNLLIIQDLICLYANSNLLICHKIYVQYEIIANRFIS